jgi:hypothetical protein
MQESSGREKGRRRTTTDEEEEQIWNVVLGLCASTRWDPMVREPLPGIAGGGREGQVGDSRVWEGSRGEE